ncbi:MAG: cytochrome B [Rhodobacter sp. CACIA14H1]|nr:MAG: cytochrome B [Rhodobacter sp. CACIA14H1]
MKVKVWDPVVRLFHWSLVAGFVANDFLTRPGKEAHQWVGYAVAGLIGLRLVWGMVATRHARFADFLPSPAAVLGQMQDMATGRRRVHEGHSPLGALMIWNLLLTVAAIAATGYAQTTLAFFGVEWVEEAHEALVVWAELSIVVHVLAVVVESRRLGVNLPKSMVTGYKTLP